MSLIKMVMVSSLQESHWRIGQRNDQTCTSATSFSKEGGQQDNQRSWHWRWQSSHLQASVKHSLKELLLLDEWWGTATVTESQVQSTVHSPQLRTFFVRFANGSIANCTARCDLKDIEKQFDHYHQRIWKTRIWRYNHVIIRSRIQGLHKSFCCRSPH